jgi:hypothetical protein
MIEIFNQKIRALKLEKKPPVGISGIKYVSE